MAMKLIKNTAEYKIFMRGDDRYAVQDASGKPVNGEEKVRILVEEELIKTRSTQGHEGNLSLIHISEPTRPY